MFRDAYAKTPFGRLSLNVDLICGRIYDQKLVAPPFELIHLESYKCSKVSKHRSYACSHSTGLRRGM